MASLAPSHPVDHHRGGGARYQTFEGRKEGRKEGRRAAWQSKSQSTAAVPFQEVISEATAAVEAEGGGSPDFTAKRDPVVYLPSIKSSLSAFGSACCMEKFV